MIEEKFGKKHRNPWGNHWITRGLDIFEKAVETSKGKYCVGDSVTLADVFLVTQLYNAARFNVDMTQFPNIVAINANLEILPEFKRAHPDKQPDAPK